jgi:tetratricopeptide (TPR) repeat protein
LSQSSLGVALSRRFEEGGDLADLERAIEVGTQAVEATPEEDPRRSSALSNLAYALMARFNQTMTVSDLDLAVELLSQAVDASPLGHPDRGSSQSDLVLGLRRRFEHVGDLADIERAIEVGTQAVEAIPEGHPHRSSALTNVGDALVVRFNQTMTASDLDLAVEILSKAVDAEPLDHPDRGLSQSSLGVALRTRFEHAGDLADLERAIDVGTQAVVATREGHHRAETMSNLGLALRDRFEQIGTLSDIDRAIDMFDQASDAASTTSRGGILSNLCVALLAKFHRTGVLADLDRAIDAAELAIEATPEGHHDYAGRLSNLGFAFLTRFRRTSVEADVERSVEVFERAVKAAPVEHFSTASFVSNLGAALNARFEGTGVRSDLDRSVGLFRRAVDGMPADSPNRTGALSNLGGALLARFDLSQDQVDLAHAIKAFREAVSILSAPPLWRAAAAQGWGQAAGRAEEWAQAVDAYVAAVNLIGEVAPRGLPRPDQEHQLAELAGIGPAAAAACLQTADLRRDPALRDRAVELFEQGRGVLFSQMLDSRTDLTDLATAHPGLARKYINLVRELERADLETLEYVSFQAGPAEHTHAVADADRRRAAAEGMDQVLAEIRAQDGFSGFLTPRPLGELLPAAGEGPVVLVSVAELRSDALALDSEGVRVIGLPGLSPSAVDDRVNVFLDSLHTAQDPAAEPAARAAAESKLSEVLAWLWDSVTGPVLDQLGFTGRPDAESWPHVFWCPSGSLAFLPLHAAGRHATRFDAVPVTVVDRVVSSTIPTIRALQQAQQGIEPSLLGNRDRPRVLVVAMPSTPGEKNLPGAEKEAEFISALLPGQVEVIGVSDGHPARHDTVLDALPGHRWVHFSCHGASDLDNPSASHLLLADHREHPLTVLDLARARLKGAELAFLSACTTARTGTKLPDEPIHLAAACQLAGFPHVIATLWPIGDSQAFQVTKRIYETLTGSIGGVSNAAQALHTTTLGLRALYDKQPSRWASHTHTGP